MRQAKTTPDRLLFVPDTHIPYHDIRAWNLMLKAAKAFKPDAIVVIGDFGDFYSVSRFDKDPDRELSLKYEMNQCNAALDQLDALKAKIKVFIAGNHEARLDKYIKDKAAALYGLVRVEKYFRLRERGWRYVGYRDHYRLGKVYFTHDIGATGRNAAHRVVDTYQHSAITGHTHRIVYVVEADGLGEPILSAQFGWLGDIDKIDYSHKITATKAYVLGFGVGYMDADGILFAQPVPIVHYKCCVNGEVYRG